MTGRVLLKIIVFETWKGVPFSIAMKTATSKGRPAAFYDYSVETVLLPGVKKEVLMPEEPHN
jgi:hypothetical protein